MSAWTKLRDAYTGFQSGLLLPGIGSLYGQNGAVGSNSTRKGFADLGSALTAAAFAAQAGGLPGGATGGIPGGGFDPNGMPGGSSFGSDMPGMKFNMQGLMGESKPAQMRQLPIYENDLTEQQKLAMALLMRG